MSKAPPLPKKPILKNLPKDLTQVPAWVCFIAPVKTLADGKTKRMKVPVDPKNGEPAKSSDPDTWGTFDQAVQRMKDEKRIAGIGYQFRHDAKISAIDLDDCFDSQGNLFPEAEEIIAYFDSWTEVSPSGNGVHIWIFGTVDQVRSQKYPDAYEKFGVEIFSSNFFMTVTGRPLPGRDHCGVLQDRGAKYKSFWKQLENQRETRTRKGDRPKGLVNVQDFKQTVIAKLTEAGLDPVEHDAVTGGSGEAGWKWRFTCPWKDEHTGGTDQAALFYYENGTCGFNCFHSHCGHRTYRDLAKKLSLPEPSYVDRYNAKHAVLRIGGRTVVLNEEIDPLTGGSMITFSKVPDFKAFYMNDVELVPSGDTLKKVRLAPAWLEHPERRQYDALVFDPSRKVMPEANAYNMFRGFHIKPAPPEGKIDGWLNHVHESICAGDATYFKYLMSWCARIIQKPGSPLPGICVVLQGGMGTGKGLFASTMCRLTMPHSIQLTRQNQLTGNFNAHLKDVLFAFADEAYWAGSKSDLGAVKGLITEAQLFVEPKGLDGFMVQNYVNIVMASNEEWVVPASLDERRFFILKVKSVHARDTSYFGPLYKNLEAGGYEGLMHYFQHYDYSDVDLRTPPTTEGLIEQKIRSMSPLDQFWQQCLDMGHVLLAAEDYSPLHEEGEWPDKVVKKYLYYGYLAFCRTMGHRYPEPHKAFCSDFARRIPGIESKRVREDGGREHAFVVPPLATCREAWAKKIGSEILDD